MVRPNMPKVVSNGILMKEAEIHRYVQAPLTDGDALEFWKVQRCNFPNLAKLARKYLATPPSSVQSERAVSELGNIYGDLRTSLTPEHAEQLAFLHHNLPRLERIDV